MKRTSMLTRNYAGIEQTEAKHIMLEIEEKVGDVLL